MEKATEGKVCGGTRSSGFQDNMGVVLGIQDDERNGNTVRSFIGGKEVGDAFVIDIG
jgi:hypothetical protein